MLDYTETVGLIVAAQKGDENAKEQLIVHNMPLIKSIVARYRNKMIEYDDLLQLGAMGLVKAINNFDVSFGVKFSTYAVPMIAGEIKRFIRDDGAIKVSRALKATSLKIQQTVNEYKQEHGDAPDVAYLAEKLGVDPQEVVFAMDSSKYPLSLYEKYDDDNSQSVIDKLDSGENGDEMIDKMIIKDFIKTLPKREKTVIVLRYFKDKTQSEIAKILGVSQVQVSRIESKIINEMKKALA